MGKATVCVCLLTHDSKVTSLGSTTRLFMPTSQGGVRRLKLARCHTDTSLSRLSHPETLLQQVEMCFASVSMLIPSQTGADTETLKIVEARIQADFTNGQPRHLLPSARSMEYTAGSDQSRIFVSCQSEFSRLHARDVQRILRERLILVHGNVLDYNYGWDLESFARLHDVDNTVEVHGKIHVFFLQFVVTKTTFSFNESSSHRSNSSPPPRYITGIPCDNHVLRPSGLSSPQRSFATVFPKKPLHSVSVRQHGVT